jgi:hypothetical protein
MPLKQLCLESILKSVNMPNNSRVVDSENISRSAYGSFPRHMVGRSDFIPVVHDSACHYPVSRFTSSTQSNGRIP